MKKYFYLLVFAYFLCNSLRAQFLYLNTDKTSYEITPDGITANKTGASDLRTFTFGRAAGQNLTQGQDNTAIGYFALSTSSNTILNTALGAEALRRNTNGVGNAALGYGTLTENTSGSFNLGIGSKALFNNTTGQSNVAIGKESMIYNVTGKNNVAIGNYSLMQNGGFLGASSLDSNSFNVAIGYAAMINSRNENGLPSAQNVALGHFAARDGGFRGVTVGYRAGDEAFQQGVVIGNKSGVRSRENTIIGDSVMISAPSNSLRNTVIGHKAMKNAGNNTSDNVAVGYKVLSEMNTAEGKNTIVGDLSMSTTSGFAKENTIFGSQSLLNFNSGNRNTGVGNSSLPSLTVSSDNTAIGWFSGIFVNTDNKFTCIGPFSGTSTSSAVVTNTTVIGSQVISNTSNSVKIGNNSTTSIGGYSAFTNFSDKRLKENISYKNTPGLAFILGLKTAKYEMKDDAVKSFRYGLIAQDVHQLSQDLNLDFPPLYKPESPEEFYRISYEKLTVPLIQAVKELSQKIDRATESHVVALKKNDELRTQIINLNKK